MCGIAGAFGQIHQISDNQISRLFDLMKKRGPDAIGKYQDEKVLIISSRLKIIDLNDRSNQPFENSNSVLGYNGEIYNYKEIKNELIKSGSKFKTESDTEVLQNYLDADLNLSDLDGMFAFVYYDKLTKQVKLARDIFGEKPLYIYKNNGTIYFGSEIKFIRQLCGELDVNYVKLVNFIANGYRCVCKNENTFFKNVKSLEPGWIYSFDLKHLDIISFPYYIKENKFKIDKTLSYFDTVERTKEILLKTFEKRMRADVPLSFCLSSGIDSNAVVGIAKKVFDYDVHAFSIFSDDPRYDERALISKAVRHYDIKHDWIKIKDENFANSLRKMIIIRDAPLSTMSYYVHFLMMRKIQDYGYKVALSGTGGDELFAGYYDHQLYYLSEMQQNNNFKNYFDNWKKYVLPLIQNDKLKDFSTFFEKPNYREHLYCSFSKDLIDCRIDEFYEKNYSDSNLKNRMANELFHEVIPIILREDDINSMYHSIENRSPFLNKELFEFIFSVPTEFLIINGMGKAILRHAVSDYVPTYITNQYRKIGFNFSFLSLITREEIKYLIRPLYDQYEIFSEEEIDKILFERKMTAEQEMFLFRCVSSAMFLNEFI